MGYTGAIYNIPCNTGGFNANPNIDFIPANSLVDGSRNVNLHISGRAKRGGTQKVFSAPVTGNPQIMGLFDFRLSGSSFQVFMTDNGSIYKNDTTTIKTGLGTDRYPSFSVFNRELFSCNGYDTPQTWNGAAASTSNITTPAADWTGTTQPFQMLPHGRGASRRMWAIMGNAVYYSSLADGKVFSGGTSGKITIETNDAYGLVGGIEFGDRLFVFSRDKGFLIDDEDATPSNWGYQAGIWLGGAAHWRVVVRIPNDVVIMGEDGDIYSLSAVQSYGDYKQASITRPAFIDYWMRENVDISQIDKFHAIYDPTLRAVKFFVVRNQQTTVDTALVYFVDRGPEDGWAIHDNLTAASGYSASCSAVVRKGAGQYAVYTGDYSGDTWEIESVDKSDDGAGYRVAIKTPYLSMENIRSRKDVRTGTLSIISETRTDIDVTVSVDGETRTPISLTYGSDSPLFDSAIFDESIFPTVDMRRITFKIGEKGKFFQFTIENNTSDQEFFLGSFLLDLTDLGVGPE